MIFPMRTFHPKLPLVAFPVRLAAVLAAFACLLIPQIAVSRDKPDGKPAVAAASNGRAPSDFRRIHEEFQKPDGKIVLVAAHRGLSGISTGQWDKSPENSLSGVTRSISIGVDIMEVDVRRTNDGQLVLMHDTTVNRTTNGQGKVADLTLAEIKRLRLRCGAPRAKVRPLSNEQVPTLEELMRLCKGKCMVNLDKAWGIVPECCDVLKKTGTLPQVIFVTSHDAARCKHELELLDPKPIYKPTFVHGKAWNREALTGWNKAKVYVDAIHPKVFEFAFQSDEDAIVSPDTVKRVHGSGARVWTNTMWRPISGGHNDADSLTDPKTGWGWMIDRGVNIIQTDEAEKLLEYLLARLALVARGCQPRTCRCPAHLAGCGAQKPRSCWLIVQLVCQPQNACKRQGFSVEIRRFLLGSVEPPSLSVIADDQFHQAIPVLVADPVESLRQVGGGAG